MALPAFRSTIFDCRVSSTFSTRGGEQSVAPVLTVTLMLSMQGMAFHLLASPAFCNMLEFPLRKVRPFDKSKFTSFFDCIHSWGFHYQNNKALLRIPLSRTTVLLRAKHRRTGFRYGFIISRQEPRYPSLARRLSVRECSCVIIAPSMQTPDQL